MYVYLGRSLPTYGRACENVRSTYRHTDGANTDGRTGVTPETYGWSTGKPTGVGTAVKRKPFHGMYRRCNFRQEELQDEITFLVQAQPLPHIPLKQRFCTRLVARETNV